MKYYLIAGEASGDLHASALVRGISRMDADAAFRGWGGDLMQKAGVHITKHYRDLSFMGFAEVISNLPAIVRNFSQCKNDLIHFQPDVLILIDYPGFNLRMAKKAKKLGIRVFYYISPQLWAWHTSRVKIIKKYVEQMFVILPFEKEFYQRYGINVDFTGHPLLDVMHKTGQEGSGERVIALMPGSRKQEIVKMLPVMLGVVSHFKEHRFIIAGLSSVGTGFYEKFLKYEPVEVVLDQTQALLSRSEAALVTSGTATLEAAVCGVPEVVCYKAGILSFLIARLIAKVKFIALPNLIAGKEVVKELIQKDMNTGKLVNELNKLLLPENVNHLKEEYQKIKAALGKEGASERAAELMVKYLKHN